LRFTGSAPAGYVVRDNNPQTALGSVVSRSPCVTDFDSDPTVVIKNGDWVKIDADQGIVEIIKR
jgi:hypothetical protein